MAALYLSLFVMLCLGEQVSVPLSERLRSLDDEDWHVRERATDALIAHRPSALPAVRSALEVAEDPEVRARLGIVERTIVLRERMAFTPAFLERYPDIYRDLARWEGKTEAYRFFDRLASSSEPTVTIANIAAMVGFLLEDGGKGLNEQEIRRVVQICKRKSVYYYFRSVEPVSPWTVPVPESAPVLAQLLGSPNLSENLRSDVAAELADLKAKTSASDLLPLLASSHEKIRDSVVAVLGGLDVPEIAPSVVALLSHADAGVRVSALNLLGLLATNEQDGMITACLDDPDPAVRGMAARALAEKREHDAFRCHPNCLHLEDESTSVRFIRPIWSWPSNDRQSSWGTMID